MLARANRVYREVSEFLYDDHDNPTENTSAGIGQLWDFYDLFPGFYNDTVDGKFSLSGLLDDRFSSMERELDKVENILRGLQ